MKEALLIASPEARLAEGFMQAMLAGGSMALAAELVKTAFDYAEAFQAEGIARGHIEIRETK